MERYAVIIAGASGSGKTSVAKSLIARHPERYSLSRSATSRPEREDDAGKNEYIFCTREEFTAKINSGDMLESTVYGENMYGTPRSELDRIMSEGKLPVLVLDLNGVRSFREADLPYPVYVFYVYENINVIEQRLYDRDLKNTQTLEALLSFQRRKQANISDYLNAPEYVELFDAYIRNGSLESCALALEECIGAFTSGAEAVGAENAAVTYEERLAVANELCSQAREKLG